MRKSILRKYLVWVLPILIVVFAVIGFGAELILRQEILSDSRSLGKTTTGNIESAMSLWIEDQIRMAKGIASDTRIVEACLDPTDPDAYVKAQVFLERMHSIHTYHENLPISSFNTKGETITVVYNGEEREIPPGAFFLDTVEGNTIGKGASKNYIAAIKNGSDVFISEVYPSILRGNPIFVIAVPVTHGGKTIGAVITAPQMDYFTKIFTQQPFLSESEQVFVGDSHGKMIAHDNSDLILNEAGTEYLQPLLDGVDEGLAEFNKQINGEESLLIAETYDMGDVDHVNEWIIFYSLKLSYIAERLLYLRIIIVIAVIAMLALLSTIIVLATRRLVTKPIKTLTEGAELLAVGDIYFNGMNRQELENISERVDEVGMIGKSFRKLIEYQTEKVEIAQEIAEKNLTVNATISSENDVLGNTFQQMVTSLNSVLGQVSSAVEQVSAGSNQVSQASQSLSRGATEQASSLEEINASINEINSQSQQNTKSAEEANALAKQASEDANEGNRQMQELSEAMEKITSSSEEINKIVKTIDDISFQINLLALNANVEAARAGKYGKGFAVVAEEVRNLANRSGDSVKETTQRVVEANNNIQLGTELVQKTSAKLKDIVKGSNSVAEFLEEITHSSREQTQGIEQITEGLDQVGEVTQSNTASAEQSASSAEELASQAEQLRSMVEQFRLETELQLEDMRDKELITEQG